MQISKKEEIVTIPEKNLAKITGGVQIAPNSGSSVSYHCCGDPDCGHGAVAVL